MGAGGLVIQEAAVCDGDLAGGGIDVEPAACVVGEGVACAVGGIGVCDGDRSDAGAGGAVLGDGVAGQIQVGGSFVDVADGDCEGLGVAVAGAVGDLDGDVVGAGGLVVEQRAVCDGDLTGRGVDGEPAAGVVGEGIAGAVGGIGVRDGDRTDAGAIGAVLGDGVACQVEVGGCFVDVADGDCEGLGIAVAGAVGDLDRDVVAARGLMVQEAAVRDGDLTGGGVDVEPAACVVGEGIAGAVGGVGVRDGDRSDAAAVGAVLGDGVADQVEVGGRLVDVVDGDCEGLGVAVAGAVGDLDGDVVAARGLVVQEAAVCDGDLAGAAVDVEPAACVVGDVADGDCEGLGVAVAGAVGDLDGDVVAARGLMVQEAAVCDGDLARGGVDVEPAACVVGEGVAGAVGGIGVRDGDRSDAGAVGAVLGDGVAGEVEVGGSFVDVVDGDCEGLGVAVAGSVGDLDRDVVGAGGFVVEQRAVCDGDLTGGGIDVEPAACVVGEGIACAVGGIGVRDGDRADAGAVGAVLGDGVADQVEVGGGLVDVADGDCEGLGVAVAGAVGDLDGDVVEPAASWSRRLPSATVISPVEALMLNLPPASSVRA